jgi:pimeloyl-ACP methyl ester carboxylesterase
MDYPIVSVKTEDGLKLHGIVADTDLKKRIVIFIHGTSSSFYLETFTKHFFEELPKNNIAFLSTDNRGAFVLDAYQNSGSAVEHFEDCIKDIDAWIKFALDRGYSEIVLVGHSLGTEKIVYYTNKGNYIDKVKAVILLGPADSFGFHYQELKDKLPALEIEAKELVKAGKGQQFLTIVWNSHAGVMPQNAESYLNLYSKGSELSKTFPFRNGGKLEYYKNIKVPVLSIIGDQHEYTVITSKEAIDLLKSENVNAEVVQFTNCSHDFIGKEEELTNKVIKFLSK